MCLELYVAVCIYVYTVFISAFYVQTVSIQKAISQVECAAKEKHIRSKMSLAA